MYWIEQYYPNWKDLSIHESSPARRSAFLRLKKQCKNYTASQYHPDKKPGEIFENYNNVNLENMPFDDSIFDIIITQDVMEHVLSPEKVFSEIARTLKLGGAHIFTVPLYKNTQTEICAYQDNNGEIIYLRSPEYHGNPVSNNGSLVATRWGYDVCDFIFRNGGLVTTILELDNLKLGVRAEHIEVLISRKIFK